ncbi:hypothetical protein FRB99_001705 [Tulasnella sp. 403]|nr:hypothetical protein FRB99_001705 [Tulasnella sp. 403]
MPSKKASTSSEPPIRPPPQSLDGPSADSLFFPSYQIQYPVMSDPGWKFELSFRDSYHTCHEKLVPYFDFMREYILVNQHWIPSRHIMAFNKLHAEWNKTMDAPPAKAFWKQELISQRGHSLASDYWLRLKDLRRELSRRATTIAVQSIMAEREVVQELIVTNRKAILDAPRPGRSSGQRQDTSKEAGPSTRESPPPFEGDDIDPDKGLSNLDIDLQLPASNAFGPS